MNESTESVSEIDTTLTSDSLDDSLNTQQTLPHTSTPHTSHYSLRTTKTAVEYPSGLTDELLQQIRQRRTPPPPATPSLSVPTPEPPAAEPNIATENFIPTTNKQLLAHVLAHISNQDDPNMPSAQELADAFTPVFNNSKTTLFSALQQIPKFSGKENPHIWFRNFEITATQLGYSEVKDRDPLLKQSLNGPALKWSNVWLAKNPTLIKDHNAYLTAWKENYLGDEMMRGIEHETAFRQCVKADDESFVEYYDNLQSLALDVNPVPKDLAFIKQYIIGLNRKYPLATNLLMQKKPKTDKELHDIIKTLDDADKVNKESSDDVYSQLAAELNTASSSTAAKKGKKVTPVDATTISSTPNTDEDPTVKIALMLQKLTADMEDMKTKLHTQMNAAAINAVSVSSTPSTTSHTPRPPTPHHSQSRPKSKSPGPHRRSDSMKRHHEHVERSLNYLTKESQRGRRIICFKCGQANHLQNDCKAPEHEIEIYQRTKKPYHSDNHSQSQSQSHTRNRSNSRYKYNSHGLTRSQSRNKREQPPSNGSTSTNSGNA